MARTPRPIDPVRRARLLARARHVFASSGYEAASLTEILRRADFSRSSFYYFFGTKEALFEAAFADGLAELAELVAVPDLATATATSFWEHLLTMVRSLSHATTRTDLHAVGVMFHLSDAPDVAALTSFRRQARDWCRQAIETGRTLGCIDPTLPADLMTDLAWSAAGTLDRWFLAHPAGPDEADALTERVLRGALAPRQETSGPP